MHNIILSVTERIARRSEATRAEYLARIQRAGGDGLHREQLSCGNLAHACAASEDAEKKMLAVERAPNLGIVSAYNDMLSAHQPYYDYPAQIKAAALEAGAVAQVAGGVPAMCDGVTQGRDGMELSLFSRDVIAMSTAIALSHDMFDGTACLGICDKIVPGLLMGALSFGHLPTLFVPAGPMPSGMTNKEKLKIRQLFAEGKVGRDELLRAETESYHSAGTCTFYGTANTNQMLMEIMGLQLPGSAFVNPDTDMRKGLTRAAIQRLAANSAQHSDAAPLGVLVDERVVVNGIVGLLATGGSTNHTIHLIAMAAAAGIRIDWQDMAELSSVVPLLCRIYPNGDADVNHFQAAGGMALLIRELLALGMLHPDVHTVFDRNGLTAYQQEPFLEDGEVVWKDGISQSLDSTIIASGQAPFSESGGLNLLNGNLGRAVIKVSAVKPEHRKLTAPAVVLHSQHDLKALFDRGELERDFVAVVRFQGPRANGMPELHKLTPVLGILQDRGFKVALVTDGRMSGASGKTPAAIHLCPEALNGGAIGRVQDGDLIELDADAGTLKVLVNEDEFNRRELAQAPTAEHSEGMGRELFAPFRDRVGPAETGASIFSN